jgi:Zn-dependent M28 family amino/carboxypeptidase
VNPAHGEMLFEGSGHTFAAILELADKEEALPRFPLAFSLRATVRHDREEVESENVVAIVPGSDPALSDEFVVLSGHLDHLGMGGAIDGDSIYNGAMDNAAGIASMIEIARLLEKGGVQHGRSIVLLAVTGEEKGLRGSQYFAAHPTVEGSGIVANLNMDMYLPIIPFTHLVAYGIDESDLGQRVTQVAERHGVALQPDQQPNRNIFIRSDQYNFIKAGVPALSFKFGAEAGTPEDKALKAWITERYHAPSDDVMQPVNAEAAAEFTHLLLDLCVDIANQPERPRWYETSFFRRFASKEPVASR